MKTRFARYLLGRLTSFTRLPPLLLLLTLPSVVQAQFSYVTNNDSTITITGYTGSGGDVVIPDRIDGLSVTGIGNRAFADDDLTSVTIPDSVGHIGWWTFVSCTNLANVTIGNSVTIIADGAFKNCYSLRDVYFKGNSPLLAQVGNEFEGFLGATNATIYYLPGTTGWTSTFGECPTAPWCLPNPVVLTTGPSFGVPTNRFGFIISWATNISVVVEACANLNNPTWSPLQTNVLADGWSYYSDPDWTNYPARFYRVRSP